MGFALNLGSAVDNTTVRAYRPKLGLQPLTGWGFVLEDCVSSSDITAA